MSLDPFRFGIPTVRTESRPPLEEAAASIDPRIEVIVKGALKVSETSISLGDIAAKVEL